MKMLHTLLLSTCALLVLGAASANAATTIMDWTVNSSVPDANPTGLVDTRTISGSTVLGITGIEVRLKLSGGWNGDLYAYLAHGTAFSILLNRVGRTSTNPFGAGSSGFDITLTDLASTDIHTGASNSGLLTGTYQPDARNVDPALAVNTSPRNAYLGSFTGLNANGAWTLFLVDNESGDQSTLVSWGLTLTQSVPEPSRIWLMIGGLTGMILRRRREEPL